MKKEQNLVPLFEYILTLSREIGEERAWNVLDSMMVKQAIEWFKENKKHLKLRGTDVEKAFSLVLKALDVNPENIKIIEKSENKIVFRLFDYCPVLEACKTLDLFTVEICKSSFEKMIQKLIEKINKHLLFERNYERIRPFRKYCEYIIELME